MGKFTINPHDNVTPKLSIAANGSGKITKHGAANCGKRNSA